MSISAKQRQILAFPWTNYDALICDGAIRSGKTALMTIAFVDDAMRRFNRQRFGICGKTVGSAVENIIVPYIQTVYATERYFIGWRKSDKILTVAAGSAVNTFEVFGGKDESSFQLIQGRTLAGVLLDEVALQPRSFVEQALARCSVAGSKLWFNCNPGSPQHWFYTEWILKAREKNALHLHFDLRDNPSLSEAIIKRYEAMYSGVFYDRYIRGLWVLAEGLVYPMFGANCLADAADRPYDRYVLSMDYGIQNATAVGLWGHSAGVWYMTGEYYHSGRETARQKTDQEYYDDIVAFAGDKPVECLIVDPSATSFIALVKQKGRFKVRPAKNDVLDGISKTASCLQSGKVKICGCCKRTIQEFGLYSWDPTAPEDKPIKDNDHSMDQLRYFVATMNLWRPETQYQSLWMSR